MADGCTSTLENAQDSECSPEITEEQKKEAESFKEKANDFFKKQDYSQAISFYTEALKINPNVATYYGNRSFAYLKTECFGYALTDASKALELDRTYVKKTDAEAESVDYQGQSRSQEVIDDGEGLDNVDLTCLIDQSPDPNLSEQVRSKLHLLVSTVICRDKRRSEVDRESGVKMSDSISELSGDSASKSLSTITHPDIDNTDEQFHDTMKNTSSELSENHEHSTPANELHGNEMQESVEPLDVSMKNNVTNFSESVVGKNVDDSLHHKNAESLSKTGEKQTSDIWDSCNDIDEQDEDRLIIDLYPSVPEESKNILDISNPLEMKNDESSIFVDRSHDMLDISGERNIHVLPIDEKDKYSDINANITRSNSDMPIPHLVNVYQDYKYHNLENTLTASQGFYPPKMEKDEQSDHHDKENDCKENLPNCRRKLAEKNENQWTTFTECKIPFSHLTNRTRLQPLTVSQSYTNHEGSASSQSTVSPSMNDSTDPNSLRTKVIFKHAAIQQEFSKLAKHKYLQVKQLEEYYKRQTAKIEAQRHDAVQDVADKSSINHSFDLQRHKLISSVEINLDSLKVEIKNKMDKMTNDSQRKTTMRMDYQLSQSLDVPETPFLNIPDQNINWSSNDQPLNFHNSPKCSLPSFSPPSTTSSSELSHEYVIPICDEVQESPLDLSYSSVNARKENNSFQTIPPDESNDGPLDLSMKASAKEFLRARILMHQQRRAAEFSDKHSVLGSKTSESGQQAVAIPLSSENPMYKPSLPPPPQLIPASQVFSQQIFTGFDMNNLSHKPKQGFETVSSTSPSELHPPLRGRGKAPRRVPYRRSLPPNATEVLMKWYIEHQDLPYPTSQEYQQLATTAGVTQTQVKTWLANKRRRTYNTLAYNGCVHPKARERAAKAFASKVNDPGSQSAISTNVQNDSPPSSVQNQSGGAPKDDRLMRYILSNTCSNVPPMTIESQIELTGVRNEPFPTNAFDKLQKWSSEHGDQFIPDQDKIRLISQDMGISEDVIQKWFSDKQEQMNNNNNNVRECVSEQYPARHFKKKPDGNRYLKPEATETLNNWYKDHEEHPYPTDRDKSELAAQCELTIAQVNCWFANKRNRNHNTRKKPLGELLDVLEQRQRMLNAVKNAMP